MNLAARTIRNAFFNSVSWALPVLISFVTLPYIVSRLGDAVYGILTLVLTIIGYFALLELGLGNAVIKYVAEYAGQDNWDAVDRVVGTMLLIMSVLSLAGGLVILLLSDVIVTRFLKVPADLVATTVTVFRLGSAGFVLTMFLSAFSGIPYGLNRYDVSGIVTVALGTATSIGTVCLLYARFGVIEIVIFNLSITFAGIVIFCLTIRHLAPAIRLTPVIDVPMLKQLFSFGVYSVLSRVAYLASHQADRFVMGAMLGVSWVTYYVVPFTLASRLMTLTVRLGSVIFPAISELQGKSRHGAVTELYLASSRVILVIATAFCLPLTIFGGHLLTLWMGPEFGGRCKNIVLLVTLALYVNALTNVPSFVTEGLGRPKVNGISAIATAALNLLLIVPLIRLLGVDGAALAFFVSNLVVAPAYIWYVHTRVLNLPLGLLFKAVYIRPLVAGFVVAVPLAAFPHNRINNLFLLLSVMVLATSGCLVASYFIGVLPREEKTAAAAYVRAMLRRMRIIAA